MRQREFLDSLEKALTEHKVANVSDILADYQEHFSHGLQKGKSEEEIAAKLGNPTTIAKAYETESLIVQVKNPDSRFQLDVALRVLVRLLVLAPFNIIVLFIPGVMIFSFLIAGWSVALALGGAGLGILGLGIDLEVISLSFWALVSTISASLGIVGMGVVSALLMFVFTKYILIAAINYLQWNLKYVLEK